MTVHTPFLRGGEWSFLLDLDLSVDWDPDGLGNANRCGCIWDEAAIRHIEVRFFPLRPDEDWQDGQSREQEQCASYHVYSIAA